MDFSTRKTTGPEKNINKGQIWGKKNHQSLLHKRSLLPQETESFKAEKIKNFSPTWKSITNDKYILNQVKRVYIKFTQKLMQKNSPQFRNKI